MQVIRPVLELERLEGLRRILRYIPEPAGE
jgi:hypothetical protein